MRSQEIRRNLFALLLHNTVVATVLPESIYPLGRVKTFSLPKCSAANSPQWDEFLNLVLDGRD